MDEIMVAGDYKKMGVTDTIEGTIFTFAGEKKADCAILLYEKRTGKKIRYEVPAKYCIGSLRSVLIRGLDMRKYEYNYEIDGKVVVDPYAVRICGRETWGNLSRSEMDYEVRSGYETSRYDWEDDAFPEFTKEDMVMYKLHVRGFTMDGTGLGKKRGTFAGLQEKLPYLKQLGVTTVELMPAYEFEELMIPKQDMLPDYVTWKIQENERERVKKENERKESEKEAGNEIENEIEIEKSKNGVETAKAKETAKESITDKAAGQQLLEVTKLNYWGYIKGNYFAPKAAYAYSRDAATEYRNLIRQMHRMSMECVMEIYFDETVGQMRMLEILRYWVMEYHVDGFHLVGVNLPIRAFVQDPLLSRTKLFYTDIEESLLGDKKQYPHLYLYRDEYLYPLRKLLNHMDGNMNEFANQQRKQHGRLGFVNYAAINNSFTLADVFSYSDKHNEANGENNADGNDYNYTANYGVEGPTRKKYIMQQRKKQVRNALAMVCLAQGIPLIASGDEFGNSQTGNNNAYCQDNETGWVNWRQSKAGQELTAYVAQLLAFRREHPVLRQGEPMKRNDYLGIGAPDLSYHSDVAWVTGYETNRLYGGMMYTGAYAKTASGDADADVYVSYNFHNGRQTLALPKPPKGKKWYLVMDTSREQPFLSPEEYKPVENKLEAGGMTVCILVTKAD